MVTPTCSQDELIAVLRSRFRETCKDVEIPPPVFKAMQAEIIAFDLDAGSLKVRFPILKEQLNPFGNMQGGMIAAMIDNTLGPLSMAVAPPNFTRHFELKYRAPVQPDIKHVIVRGQYIERKQRQLFFTASLSDCRDRELVSAKSVHWIIDESDIK